MSKRQTPSRLVGFIATLMLLSWLLWAFGTLHATFLFLWTLVHNATYTISRWVLEHPGAAAAAISNVLMGFDIFDTDFINFQSCQTVLSRLE
jgi:hypothetical protein